MKTYKKSHKTEKAAKTHIAKIKKRGGNVKKSVKNGKILLEYSFPEILTIYHGTKPKFVDRIKKNGLEDKTGYNQGWFLVATDLESAIFHADPGIEKNAYVIEFKIPITNNDRWLGYPYLWKGEKRNKKSTWFALKQKIPKKFISKIHKIPKEKWITQKNKGF